MGGLFVLCLLSVFPSSLAGADCGSQVIALPSSKQNFTAENEFPWMVSLRGLHNSHIAMGCILSEYWIVSVASGFQNRNQTFTAVGITGPKSRSLPLPIHAVILHEDFDELTLTNNIALVKMAKPFDFSETLQPVCFPHQEFPTTALKSCLVAGWLSPHTGKVAHLCADLRDTLDRTPGETSRAPSGPILWDSFQFLRPEDVDQVLVSVRPTTCPLDPCPSWLIKTGSGSLRKLSVEDIDPCPLTRTLSTECSSHREGDSAPGCLGDPGNPIMCQAEETGHWVLKGMLTEGGARCYGPFLYTRLSYYSDWIVTTTEKGSSPISPSLGRRDFAIWTTTEEPSKTPRRFLDSRVLNFSAASEDPHLSPGTELQQGNTEGLANGSARSQDESEPIYYDYYNGELLPMGTASRGRPQGLLAASLLLIIWLAW